MKNIWLKADVLGVYQPFLSASNVLKLYNFEIVDIKVIGFRTLILVKNELKRDIIWRKMLTSLHIQFVRSHFDSAIMHNILTYWN